MNAMRPATLLRLALAGTRTDTLRVVLTAFSAALAALAALCALTVLAVDAPAPPGAGSAGWSMQYTHALLREPGLRPGVAFTFLLMTIPVLALAGQCARIGAPARDRRLAALRLAGATPRQTTAVAVGETGLAAFVGTVAGLGVYFLLRVPLHDPDPRGRLPLPTDVLPAPAALAAVVAGLPLLAAAAAAVLLRRTVMSPLGVTRRARRRRAPRPWPAALIALGVTTTAATQWAPLMDKEPGGPPVGVTLALLLGGGLCAVLGVVLGTGWITHTTGRVLHRFARRPATLIAARRLQDDPWSGSRTFAALLVCVVFGAGAAAFRTLFEALIAVRGERQRRADALAGRGPIGDPVPHGEFYLSTMDLIQTAVLLSLTVATLGLLAGLAEGIVSRRRAHAALVAAGVPRQVLRRVLAWQALAPLVPATLLALTVGTLLGRGYGHEVQEGGTPRTLDVVRQAEVAWDELALYGAVTFALAAAAVGVGFLFLRAGSSVEELRTG